MFRFEIQAGNGTGVMFGDMRLQTVKLRECLITGITMVMFLAFQLTEGPTTGQFRAVSLVSIQTHPFWKQLEGFLGDLAW